MGQCKNGHHGDGDDFRMRASKQPEQKELTQLKQVRGNQARTVPATDRRNDATQRQHDPVGQREDEGAQRIAGARGHCHALVLHVEPKQTGTSDEAKDHLQQQGDYLIEHDYG